MPGLLPLASSSSDPENGDIKKISSIQPYSEIFYKSTGTIEKNPPKYLAVRTFFAVLLAIIQEFEMLY